MVVLERVKKETNIFAQKAREKKPLSADKKWFLRIQMSILTRRATTREIRFPWTGWISRAQYSIDRPHSIVCISLVGVEEETEKKLRKKFFFLRESVFCVVVRLRKMRVDVKSAHILPKFNKLRGWFGERESEREGKRRRETPIESEKKSENVCEAAAV
jgi:hypothetical protein